MGESLSSVFSPDGALISASAAPHCEVKMDERCVCKDGQEMCVSGQT